MAGMLVRKSAAAALSAVATGLSVGARLTSRVAGLVRPERQQPARESRAAQERPAPGAAGQVAERGAVREPPTEPTPDVPSHVRSHETHAEELAARTAAEVVEVIPDLSTDELRRLYEYETANKRRKTVLTAIERAAEPNTQPPGHEEPMPEAGGVPTGGGPPQG